MKPIRRLLVGCALAACVVATTKTVAEVRYHVTDLGGRGVTSLALTINELGQIAGQDYLIDEHLASPWMIDPTDGYRGIPISAEVPRSSGSSGINNHGKVAGYRSFAAGTEQDPLGFIYDYDTHETHLYAWGAMHDINDAGLAAGQQLSIGPSTLGFVYDALNENADPVPLPVLDAQVIPAQDQISSARALNNLGQPVGSAMGLRDDSSTYHQRAVVWNWSSQEQDYIPESVGDQSQSLEGVARAISDTGWVVGYEVRDEGRRAFIHNLVTDEIWNLDPFDGHDRNSASGVNDAGDVVGDSLWGGDLASSRAFLYEDGVMYDLNDLIDPENGWILTGARDINNTGQIVGEGYFDRNGNGVIDTVNSLDYSAFLLTPIPEPASLALLGLGGMTLLQSRR